MQHIPHGVLSERFQQQISGRRVRTAVFLTFRLEPDFFEQEVLPVVIDLPFSHVPAVRLLQMEDALKSAVDHVAVYYDRGGLMAGAQSARLDVRRIPTSHGSGCFHPKNVFLLVESPEADANGHRAQQLIVATLSANLTRAGWWENIEVCHFEEVGEEEPCSFRDDVLDMIARVKLSARAEEEHDALDAIRAFVRKLGRRQHRTGNGVLHPRFYGGGQPVVDFLDEVLGDRLGDLCLEVISPYFDKSDAAPLRALCERFTPRETRVFLPRADDGSGLCDKDFYDAARKLDGVHFAQLPSEMLRRGKAEQVKRRTVHAKVYRFFNPGRRYEALLVGSVNLTTPAFSKGGNFETAFLIETDPNRRPDWWLDVDGKKPAHFMENEGEENTIGRTALSVRYNWARGTAAAYWDSTIPSGVLKVSAQGAGLFEIESLAPREWHTLPKEAASELARILPSTSFLAVSEDGSPEATILVQEEGMAQKPSLLFALTAADILRYWALLTPDQRAAFLDDHAGSMQEALDQLGMDSPPLGKGTSSIFDTFAGIFHAFHAMERAVLDALEAGRVKEAEYRLLGKKYDSMPNLLKQVLEREKDGDVVGRYVIVLCARQLVTRIEREAPEFRQEHAAEFRALKSQITRAEHIRDQFTFGTPEERAAFLEWFDDHFLRRAEAAESVA